MATASAPGADATLVSPGPEHIDELGRICYEAFKDVADAHGFPPDFQSVQLARRVIGMLVNRPDFYGVAAMVDGQLTGSNFLSLSDPVADGPVIQSSDARCNLLCPRPGNRYGATGARRLQYCVAFALRVVGL